MDDWVLDSLVGFLKSPTWTIPRNSFTDHNCVVFDPGEENKFSYTDIHKEYHTLVENLLESFTSDLGISGDQFTHACSQMLTSKIGQDNEELFEQVLAADDFLLFKSIMVRRNIDLELQALTLLRNQTGHSPVSYNKESTPGDTSDDSSSVNRVKSQKEEEEDEKILREAVKLSEEQYELERSMENDELQRLIEQAKQESLEMYKQQQHIHSLVAGQKQVIAGVGESMNEGESKRSFESAAAISPKSEGEDSTSTSNMGLDSTIQVEDKRRGEEDGASIARSPEQSNITFLAGAPQITPTTTSHLNGGDSEREVTPEAVEGNRTTDTHQVHNLLTPHHTSDREQSQQSSLAPSREGGAAIEDTVLEMTAGSREQGSNDSDTMARWLEVAKANLASDATSRGENPSVTEENSTGPTPEQLRAREIYLKKQRDHLLEVTKKQRKQALHNTATTSTHKQPHQRSSTTQQATTGEGSSGVGGTRDRGGRSSRARYTGVLSSTIASNLKKN